MNCSLTDQQRKQDVRCRGMECVPCKEFFVKEKYKTASDKHALPVNCPRCMGHGRVPAGICSVCDGVGFGYGPSLAINARKQASFWEALDNNFAKDQFEKMAKILEEGQ